MPGAAPAPSKKIHNISKHYEILEIIRFEEPPSTTATATTTTTDPTTTTTKPMEPMSDDKKRTISRAVSKKKLQHITKDRGFIKHLKFLIQKKPKL